MYPFKDLEHLDFLVPDLRCTHGRRICSALFADSHVPGALAPGNSCGTHNFSPINFPQRSHPKHRFPHQSPLRQTMVVKIRLARFGKRNAPFYNIVVAKDRYINPPLPPSLSNISLSQPPISSPLNKNPLLTPSPLSHHSRTARNSKPIEVLGTYDPIPKPPPLGEKGKPTKDIKLDTSRAKYWLGVGAQPSDPMWRLLSMVRVACFVEYSSLVWGL